MVRLRLRQGGNGKKAANARIAVLTVLLRLWVYAIIFVVSFIILWWSGTGYQLDHHLREVFKPRRFYRIIAPFKPPPDEAPITSDIIMPAPPKENGAKPLDPSASKSGPATPDKPEVTPEQRKKAAEIVSGFLSQFLSVAAAVAPVPKSRSFPGPLLFATLLFSVIFGEGVLRAARFFRGKRHSARERQSRPLSQILDSSPAYDLPGYERNIPAGKDNSHIFEKLHFSLTGPLSVKPGSAFTVDVWAHLAAHRQAIIEMARQELGKEEIYLRSKGPVRIARGSVLTVQLQVEGLKIDEPQDFIEWAGEIGKADFLLLVPEDAREGSRPGKAQIYLQGQRIVKIDFFIKIGREQGSYHRLPTRGERHRRAFMSYAGADKDQVFPRIHGMQKVAPDLLVFLDAAMLRSGEYWEKKLWEVIPTCDVFYLFWSRNASTSPWVEKEWRCALDTKGLDFIDPVPLVSPEEIPPPLELASKHFNDWILAFMRTSEMTLNKWQTFP